MRTNRIVSRARSYQEIYGASPAESLLDALIDAFTNDDSGQPVEPAAVQQSWEKLSRDLTMPEWLQESQVLVDGLAVLAANLLEAGRPDLGAMLRELHEPRFERAMHSPDVDIERLQEVESGAVGDGNPLLWVPRPASMRVEQTPHPLFT